MLHKSFWCHSQRHIGRTHDSHHNKSASEESLHAFFRFFQVPSKPMPSPTNHKGQHATTGPQVGTRIKTTERLAIRTLRSTMLHKSLWCYSQRHIGRTHDSHHSKSASEETLHASFRFFQVPSLPMSPPTTTKHSLRQLARTEGTPRLRAAMLK